MTGESITMTQKELSRYEVIKRLIKDEINGTEAALELNLSIRQTKRLKAGVKKLGILGVIHKNRGKSSNRKIPDKNIEKLKQVVNKEYHDFGPTFASEKLAEIQKIKISKEKLRQLMINWGLWKPKPRKVNNQYRRWRPRKEYYGQMEQFDGSYHKWFEDRAPACCLLASIDDAQGKITKLRFVDWEGVKAAFTFWKKYVEEQGKPVSIYLDRHSTYKQNQKSVFDDPEALTQFERAMKDLDIEVIHAYSPQSKGRIERLFETLQDRLIKELRLAGINNKKEANEFAQKVFIPKFNAKFAVLPFKPGNLHRPLTDTDKKNLDRIFSVQNNRVVNNDFTVRYKRRWFQLGKKQPTLVLKKDKVTIEERLNGQIFISLKGKYLIYQLLPKRPEKIINIPIIGLTRNKARWKPPLNHPWKRSFAFFQKSINKN